MNFWNAKLKKFKDKNLKRVYHKMLQNNNFYCIIRTTIFKIISKFMLLTSNINVFKKIYEFKMNFQRLEFKSILIPKTMRRFIYYFHIKICFYIIKNLTLISKIYLPNR